MAATAATLCTTGTESTLPASPCVARRRGAAQPQPPGVPTINLHGIVDVPLSQRDPRGCCSSPSCHSTPGSSCCSGTESPVLAHKLDTLLALTERNKTKQKTLRRELSSKLTRVLGDTQAQVNNEQLTLRYQKETRDMMDTMVAQVCACHEEVQNMSLRLDTLEAALCQIANSQVAIHKCVLKNNGAPS